MTLQNYLNNTKALFNLALPILITQLIQNLVGFFDTVMAGRVSATDLAAVALASSIWVPIVLTIYGLFMAIATIVARYSGQNNQHNIMLVTVQGIWLAIILGVILIVSFIVFLPKIAPYLPIDEKLATLTIDYLRYIVWGAPAYFIFMVIRNFYEGLSLTKATMIISIVGLLLNIPLNYLFIYGEFGINAYGGAGCGIASAIVYTLMCAMMIIYLLIAKKLKNYRVSVHLHQLHWPEIKHILTLGIPIALSLLFEVSLFSVVSILLAPYGATIVAGHQVALNFTGILFMIPLSLAMAVTIKVGFALGENQIAKAKEICRHAMITSVIIASFTATFTYLLKTPIASIYSTDIEVIELAASLMMLACLYQFSDAIQVISAGALRSYKDTQAILWLTLISYWLIGLTLGYYLATSVTIIKPLGPAGYWVGFIIGLSTAAVLLFARLKKIQTRLINTEENNNFADQISNQTN